MLQKTIFSTIAFFVLTMVIAYSWHLIWFHDLYQQWGAMTRPQPIMEFGMLAVLIQGSLMSYFYSRYYRGGHPLVEGVKFGLLFGLVVYSVMAFANSAKFNINPVSTFIFYQTVFQFLQFVITGAAMGLIFGRDFHHNTVVTYQQETVQ